MLQDIAASVESLHTLLRNILPGYVILLPIADVLINQGGIETFLLAGLLTSVVANGIREVFRFLMPFRWQDEWKKRKILGAFCDHAELDAQGVKNVSTEYIVRAYKYLQDTSSLLQDHHEDAHRVASQIIFYETICIGVLPVTVFRGFAKATNLLGLDSRYMLWDVLGPLLFVLSLMIALALCRRLNSIDEPLIKLLSHDPESRHNFKKFMEIYTHLPPVERRVTADAIVYFRPANSDVGHVILEKRKSGSLAGKLVLPGGHAIVSDNDLKGTLVRELKEEIGLELKPEAFKLLGVYDEITRDAFYVSVCYYGTFVDRSDVGDRIMQAIQGGVPETAQEEVEAILARPLQDILMRDEEEFGFGHLDMLRDFSSTVLKE